jgi:hypothetical protein
MDQLYCCFEGPAGQRSNGFAVSVPVNEVNDVAVPVIFFYIVCIKLLRICLVSYRCLVIGAHHLVLNVEMIFFDCVLYSGRVGLECKYVG